MVLGLGALLAPQVVELGAATAKHGFKKGQAISVELFSYDFVGLLVKLIIFGVIAVAIEKIHFVITGVPTIVETILSAFGLKLPTQEPDFLKRLFSEEGFNGFRYWDVIKFIFIAIVAIEFARYTNANKKLGGEPDAVTMAIFGIILFAMTAFTVPELISKLKLNFNRQAGV